MTYTIKKLSLDKLKIRNMSEEFENLDEFEVSGENGILPNATAVLVLGILSIVTCLFYGIIGIILGIIAVVMHKKDKAMYESNKSLYAQSFKNSRAGYVCGIIGLSLSALYFLIFAVAIVIGISGAAAASAYNF